MLEVILFMWSLFFRCLSMKKPRFHTISTGVTWSSLIWILVWPNLCSCWCVPRMINSIFPSLSFSRFMHIHSLISLIHLSRPCMHASLDPFLLGLKVKYSWVSSAYRWWDIWCLLQILPRGTVYRANKIGPRTLPCGTPQVMVIGSDVTPRSVPRSPIATCWVLPVRKEVIHLRAVPFIPKTSF